MQSCACYIPSRNMYGHCPCFDCIISVSGLRWHFLCLTCFIVCLHRGIDVVRQEIQDFASTKTIFSNKFKLIILDECDAMTRDAQMALRRGEGAAQG